VRNSLKVTILAASLVVSLPLAGWAERIWYVMECVRPDLRRFFRTIAECTSNQAFSEHSVCTCHSAVEGLSLILLGATLLAAGAVGAMVLKGSTKARLKSLNVAVILGVLGSATILSVVIGGYWVALIPWIPLLIVVYCAVASFGFVMATSFIETRRARIQKDGAP